MPEVSTLYEDFMENNQLTKQSPASEEERLQSLRSFTRVSARDNLGVVIAALGDESWRVRKEAVEIFLSIPEAVVLAGEIAELLHSPDNAGLRNAAVDILTRLGEPAVSRLLEELDTQDRDVRKFVLDILGDIRSTRGVHRILAELSDSDPNVRNASAENLGKIGSAEAVPALLEAMKTADLYFRFTILEALGVIGVPVPEEELLAYKGERLLLKAIYDCLGRVGGEGGIDSLMDGLMGESRNTREAAVVALERISHRMPEILAQRVVLRQGPELSAAIRGLFKDGSGEPLRAAVRLAGLSGDAGFALLLLELCRREELREEAVASLGRLGNETTNILREAWGNADGRTRLFLAYIWGEIRSAGVDDLLLQGIESGDPELMSVAARTLGKIGSEKTIRPLIACLDDQDDSVRHCALLSLVDLGGAHEQQVFDNVRPLLDSSDELLRCQAVSILGRLGGSRVDSVLAFALKDESVEVRRAAVSGLGATSSRQLPVVTMALADEDAQVRRLAAEALGRSGAPEALEPLALALNDEDLWVRAAAVKALGGLGSDQAFLLLEASVLDPVGLVALSALEAAESFEPRKREILASRGLEHEDSEVILVALRLLSEMPGAEVLADVSGRLINHGHWDVRLHAARACAAVQGGRCRKVLEDRLLIEGDDLIRSELREILGTLEAGAQGEVKH